MKMSELSKERVINALKEFGLSSVDIQVYIFLAKNGPNKMREIAAAKNLNEKEVEHSLKDLLSLEIVKTSIENPLEFNAMTFEDLIDLFIEVKKEKTKNMQENREELLLNWSNIMEENSSNI
jgi:sugar-specific transcriptional regulator TrmB